jgi:hypothetical protein
MKWKGIAIAVTIPPHRNNLLLSQQWQRNLVHLVVHNEPLDLWLVV